MTDDIVAFIQARLDEEQRIAREAVGTGTPRIGNAGQWNAYLEGGEDGWAIESDDAADGMECIVGNKAMADHIALHDPARELRGAEAKRRMLQRASAWIYDAPDGTLTLGMAQACWRQALTAVASEWSTHPEYRQEWSV